MMEMVQCNQPAIWKRAAHPPGMVPYWGMHTDPICLSYVGHSAVAVSTLALWVPDSCITSIPATMAALFLSPLGSDRMAGEKGWPVSTKQIIQSTLFLKYSSTKVIFWWAFTWDTNIFHILCPFEGSIHIPLPTPSCHQLPNHVPSKSLPTQAHYWPQPMNLYSLIPLAFLLPDKWTTRCSDWSYTPLVDTSLVYIVSIC